VPQAQVRKTVLLLRQARRPLVVVGSQALLEVDRADELADALASLGAPTYLVDRANGLLPPTRCVPCPLAAGDPSRSRRPTPAGRTLYCVGGWVAHPSPLLLRSAAHFEALARHADVVLLLGAPLDYRLAYGRHFGPNAVLVAVNRSKRTLTLNRYGRRPRAAARRDTATAHVVVASQHPARIDPWPPQRQAPVADGGEPAGGVLASRRGGAAPAGQAEPFGAAARG